MRKLLFSAALTLALSACNGGVPLSTQWKLRSYDPSTADVAPLRVAVRAPEWLEPTPEKGRIVVEYWREEEQGVRHVLTIRTARAAHDADAPALAQLDSETAGRLFIFEVDRRDLGTIRAAQDEGRRWKEASSRAHGELRLEGAHYCRRGDIPEGPIPLDLYVHTDDSIGWLPLLTQFDAHRPGVDEKKLDESMPPCPKTAARIGSAKIGK